VIQQSYGQNYIGFSKDIYRALQDLKAFNYEQIYFHPMVKSQDQKIQGLFQSLFRRYVQDIEAQNHSSPIYRHFITNMTPEYSRKNPPARIAADFIAAMTDDFFNQQYKDLFFPTRFGLKIHEKKTD
jgi:dGTPase